MLGECWGKRLREAHPRGLSSLRASDSVDHRRALSTSGRRTADSWATGMMAGTVAAPGSSTWPAVSSHRHNSSGLCAFELRMAWIKGLGRPFADVFSHKRPGRGRSTISVEQLRAASGQRPHGQLERAGMPPEDGRKRPKRRKSRAQNDRRKGARSVESWRGGSEENHGEGRG